MSTGASPPNSSSVSASPPPEKSPGTTPPPAMASPPLISPPSPANNSQSPPPQPAANSSLSPPPQPSTPPPTTSPPPPPPPQANPPSPPPPPPSSPPPKSQPQPPPPSSPPPQSPPPPPPPTAARPPENSPAPPQPPPSPPSNNSPPSQPPPTPPTNTAPPAPPTSSPPPSPPLSPPPNSPVVPEPPRSPTDPIPPPPPPPQSSSLPPLINTSPPPPVINTNATTTTPSFSLAPPNRANIAPENSQPDSGGGIGTGATIGIAVAVVLLLLGIFGTVACCLRKRRRKPPGRSASLVLPAAVASSSDIESESRKGRTPNSYHGSDSSNGNIAQTPRTPGGGGGLMNSRSWFTYEELLIATNGFSDSNLLGEGGFGCVYKGVLSDGKEVAVKQLKIGGSQGEREFRAEVEIISRIHHRHLVSLVGYCIYDDGRILVYEYVPNNNLYFHLHGEGRPVMNWATRVKIAIGSARGLAYLHEDCHPRVIHRDIKTSNILLDNNFEARVSDFGLAKLAMDANTHVTTRVVGTFGYMAPEYASSGKLTEKSDVFSFGVVLLELITGRKPLDTSEPLGDESLVEWARPLLSDAIESHEFGRLADSRLNGNYDEGEMFRMIEAAAACVRHSSSKRPTMGQVVRAFDTMSTSDLTNGMRLGESDVYDHAPSTHVRVFQRMVNRNGDFTTDSFFRDSYVSEERPINSTSNQRR